ncbi:MAG: MarR family transcriptional regulator [Candidatus Sericytochromatia bacterium]|nr:MarR family transcriptional regulator [Candidatus Sericytochromatia bacterium]
MSRDAEHQAEVEAYEHVMSRLVGAYRGRITRVCRTVKLTPPQLCALETIQRLQRTKMSPLAEELNLSMGAASTLIDRLVTRGLVARDADPVDRRAVYVSLSASGRDVLGAACEARRGLVRQVFQALSPTERTTLMQGLGLLADAWERVTEGTPEGSTAAPDGPGCLSS